MNVWEGRQERFDLTELACYRELKDTKRLERSLGTLGGGNHFIEIDEAGDGTKYLVIHSGSRNLGKQVAELYQKLAINLDRGCSLGALAARHGGRAATRAGTRFKPGCQRIADTRR